MSAKKRTTDQVRKKIEESILIAEEDRKRKLSNQRLSLVKMGVQAFQKHDLGTAIKSFVSYIKILEDIRGVDQDGLAPQHFDLKKDLSELIMISGVYWDLCKIYDRVTVENADFQKYMRKYIQFTKGMPFQAVCAESLRKFIANGKPKHTSEFKAAYKILAVSRCFVVTSLIDVIDEPTLPTLRAFRDQILAQKSWGRKLITWYYRNGPQVADRVDRLPSVLRVILGKCLNVVAVGASALINEGSNSARSKSKLTLSKIEPERPPDDHSLSLDIFPRDETPVSTIV